MECCPNSEKEREREQMNSLSCNDMSISGTIRLEEREAEGGGSEKVWNLDVYMMDRTCSLNRGWGLPHSHDSVLLLLDIVRIFLESVHHHHRTLERKGGQEEGGKGEDNLKHQPSLVETIVSVNSQQN